MAEESHVVQTEVITPEGPVFKGEVEMVSTRTAVGEIGIKANHVPVMARLVPATLRLHMPGGEVERWAQGEGWLQVFANEALVLVQDAIKPEDLDSSDLQEKLRDAEERMSREDEGSHAYAVAEADKARAEAFLELASG